MKTTSWIFDPRAYHNRRNLTISHIGKPKVHMTITERFATIKSFGVALVVRSLRLAPCTSSPVFSTRVRHLSGELAANILQFFNPRAHVPESLWLHFNMNNYSQKLWAITQKRFPAASNGQKEQSWRRDVTQHFLTKPPKGGWGSKINHKDSELMLVIPIWLSTGMIYLRNSKNIIPYHTYPLIHPIGSSDPFMTSGSPRRAA